MPPVAIAAAVVAGGQVAGSIASKEASRGALGNANNNRVIANNLIQELQQAPDIQKPLILQKYKQAGILTPEMEQNITAQVPAAIGQDSQAVSAQRQALQQMQQRASGGLTAGDRSALAESQQKAQGDVTSRLGSIQQQQAAQGLSDSGSKLAMQLAAAQGGANTEASNANQMAQQAQQAALQSTAQAAGLGGQLEGQQFGEGVQNQQAANQMQRFNIQNQIGAQQRNVGTSNEAQAANLANAQQLSNANVSGQNQEMNNQLQRQMQQWNSNNNLATMKSNSLLGIANSQQAEGERAGQAEYNTIAGPTQAVGSMIGGGFGGGSSKPFKTTGTNAGYGKNTTNMNPNAAKGDYAALWTGGEAKDYTAGGHVDGKEMVPGDHPMNDTVDAKLSPGEIVIPKTLAKSPLGRKLLKLLEDHHHVQKELDKHENNG